MRYFGIIEKVVEMVKPISASILLWNMGRISCQVKKY